MIRLYSILLVVTTGVFILFSHCVYAADQNAESCSAADIQAAIDTCVSTGGGTVTIPACNAFNTWGAGDIVFKDVGTTELRVVGQGTDEKVEEGGLQGANTKENYHVVIKDDNKFDEKEEAPKKVENKPNAVYCLPEH